MKTLNSLSMQSKLMLLGAVFTLGFIVFGAVAFRTISVTKIGGQLYGELVDVKALTADVLPPPGYIVETYLLSHVSATATEDDKAADLLTERMTRYAQLKSEYATFVKKWSEKLSDDELKDGLLKSTREPAEAFFAIMDQEYFPALKAKDYEKVNSLVDDKLASLFEKHNVAMLEVIKLITKRESDTEAQSSETVSASISGLWASPCWDAWVDLQSGYDKASQDKRLLTSTMPAKSPRSAAHKASLSLTSKARYNSPTITL